MAVSPGIGKTTLLSQALAEDELAPRGVDSWRACHAGDSVDQCLDELRRGMS